MRLWLSLSAAAEYLDCSKDTILRRAVPWEDLHAVGTIRYKHLKLGGDSQLPNWIIQRATARELPIICILLPPSEAKELRIPRQWQLHADFGRADNRRVGDRVPRSRRHQGGGFKDIVRRSDRP